MTSPYACSIDIGVGVDIGILVLGAKDFLHHVQLIYWPMETFSMFFIVLGAGGDTELSTSL